MTTLLTIAGFDPSSGAGVTADLAVFSAHGFFGTACVSAMTVQSTVGVACISPTPSELVAQTLRCLEDDLPPTGIKVGMLANKAIVLSLTGYLEKVRRERRRPTVVLDPVLRSSSGVALLTDEGIEHLQSRLLPLVDWVTPNLDELAILSGRQVRTQEDALIGADFLRRQHSGLGIVVTGGHLEGGADDLVASPDGALEWLRGDRIASRSTHGTGCAFSSAMLCGLVRGKDGLEAARDAKNFVYQAIWRAKPIGKGNGPMNLLWPLEERTV